MAYLVSVFSLNQWALDFVGNAERVIRSIDMAKQAGAVYRVGPELELSGYSLEDSFYENDTVFHSWMSMLKVINHSKDMDLVIDVGLPVHNQALYNARVIAYRGKIICIRAKTSLAGSGNYREFRHFEAWDTKSGVHAYKLPSYVAEQLSQEYVPFGANFILELSGPSRPHNLRVGWEVCQELWDIKNVSSDLYHEFGCHLIMNSSGSYWELRKLNTVTDIIKSISLRAGACYALSNLVGCDGQRYVFYGRSCIFENGDLMSMTPVSIGLFEEVQMITHLVKPGRIDERRAQNSIKPGKLVKATKVFNMNKFDYSEPISSQAKVILDLKLSEPQVTKPNPNNLKPSVEMRFEEEIQLYVPLWMWDYLRRSRMKGFMMPLSGGLDSSTVSILVYCMCNHLYGILDQPLVENYFGKVHGLTPDNIKTQLTSPRAICKLLLKCSYISTEYSSEATRRRAERLSEAIGADYSEVPIHDIYANYRNKLTLNKPPSEVTLLDQNLQARLRMTATYYLSGGNRIVLATGNVDEAIMGYLTKYDCSSADINPIGGLCKADLKSFLIFCCANLFKSDKNFVTVVGEIINAPPSAELTGSEQRDEDEIGLTYDEISVLGRVRRGIYGCNGPRGAFEYLWTNRAIEPYNHKIRCFAQAYAGMTPVEVAEKLSALIKRFYTRFANSRHKMTVLTPALHAETYSPDDNRFDHRHFLYAPWTEQFECLDGFVEEIRANGHLSTC